VSGNPTGDERVAPDEVYADAYSEGYGEGLREGLREVLSHMTRGHTVGEIRMLVESRLARLREEVELKRRSLLSPPRRPGWRALLRPPGAFARAAEGGSGEGPRPARGGSYLFREDRPRRGPAFAARAAAGYPRVICVSVHPPEIGGVPVEKLQVLRLALPSPGLGAVEGELDPSGLAGRIREATESDGGVLVYLDAIELMGVEYSIETTLKFVNWVTAQVARTGSLLVASVDPGALDERDLRRLQRSFSVV
jgi:hypothetical protein